MAKQITMTLIGLQLGEMVEFTKDDGTKTASSVTECPRKIGGAGPWVVGLNDFEKPVLLNRCRKLKVRPL